MSVYSDEPAGKSKFEQGFIISTPSMAVKWSEIFENARVKAVKSIANAQARGIIYLWCSTIFSRHSFSVGRGANIKPRNNEVQQRNQRNLRLQPNTTAETSIVEVSTVSFQPLGFLILHIFTWHWKQIERKSTRHIYSISEFKHILL